MHEATRGEKKWIRPSNKKDEDLNFEFLFWRGFRGGAGYLFS
jgi:hypothetical protein